MDRDRRVGRAPLPADRADRGGGGAGADSAGAQRLLRANGRRLDGRVDRGHAADDDLPAGVVRRLVPGPSADGELSADQPAPAHLIGHFVPMPLGAADMALFVQCNIP